MTVKTDLQAALPRRTFLKRCAGASLAAASLSSLAGGATEPARKTTMPLIIDALGEFSNPNLSAADQAGPDRGVDARALADTKASGLSAVNLTIGYVAGSEDPFELSVRDIGVWDALIRQRSGSLMKVLTA